MFCVLGKLVVHLLCWTLYHWRYQMVSSALLDGQCWHKEEFVLPFSAQTSGQMHALVKCSLTCHYSFVLTPDYACKDQFSSFKPISDSADPYLTYCTKCCLLKLTLEGT